MTILKMPDARHSGMVLRPITWAARTWLYQNTNAKKICANADAIPDSLLIEDSIVQMMRDDGLTVD